MAFQATSSFLKHTLGTAGGDKHRGAESEHEGEQGEDVGPLVSGVDDGCSERHTDDARHRGAGVGQGRQQADGLG